MHNDAIHDHRAHPFLGGGGLVSGGEIYLDHATSSPLAPEVTAAITDALRLTASPDSVHPRGAATAVAVSTARAQLADLIGAEPEEIIFTAGATEARNLAVKGLLSANADIGTHVVTSEIEHPAVLSAVRSHIRAGKTASFVGVDSHGYISPVAFARAVTDATSVASIHHAQYEIGTIQDVPTIAEAIRDAHAPTRIHLDASDSIGILHCDVSALGVDAVSISGTPIGAPAWTGALWVRPGARLHPLIEGGAQEFGKRAGAVDVAGIIGLGVAAARRQTDLATHARQLRRHTEMLSSTLMGIGDVRRNGPEPATRLPGHLQISVAGMTGESLALALATRGVLVAPGSTCTADAGKASPTLEAIGCSPEWTHSAILITIGATTTDDEIARAGFIIEAAIRELRAMSPLSQ